MPMCSSQVLLGLELSARARSRDQLSRDNVFELILVGGCKYERYVCYTSTDKQILALQAKLLDMENIEARLQLTMNALQKEVGASKYRACEAVVVPIIVQGRNEVRNILVEAGIGRPY